MRETYITGAQLASVRAKLERPKPEQRAAIEYLCGVSVREIAAPADPLPHTHAIIAQVAVGILQRGRPTLSSPRVERALIATLAPDAGVTITESPGGNLSFIPTYSTASAHTWLGAILRAHLPFDTRTCPDEGALDDADSREEARFFTALAPDALGPVAAFLEPQRHFGSIRAGDPSLRRVDFALESPGGARVVVEIDGDQHRHSPQREIDADRDRQLARDDWQVVRIPTADLDADRFAPHAAALRACFDGDTYLGSIAKQAARKSPPSASDAAAFRLVVAPHAIARIQLGLLRAITCGALRLDARKWRIGVIERDLPCAHLAVADLLDLVGHLCAFHGIDFQPTVCLDCHAAYPPERHVTIEVAPPAFGRITVGNGGDRQTARPGVPPPLDALIDVGVCAHPTVTYGDDAQVQRLASSARYTAHLRTAHRLYPNEAPQWHAPRTVAACDEANITYFLQTLFRKRALRGGQLPIIERALRRQDVIGLLPTGAGKSITFQLPALLTPGFAVVVDPLIALMQDQVQNLAAVGIDAVAAFNSAQEETERLASDTTFGGGAARFVFIAPERLQMRKFRADLRTQSIARPVSFVVIDEAHCVSEWGHDFRTAYLNLGRLGRELCRYEGVAPPLLALTGTASRDVLADVQRELAVADPEAVVMAEDFDRPNLRFLILRDRSDDKGTALAGLLAKLPGALNVTAGELFAGEHGGLIFVPNVNGTFGIVAVEQQVRERLGDRDVKVELYSGSAPKELKMSSRAWNAEKSAVLRRFNDGDISLVVATKAFGMGIDKPNIRYTIHYGIPGSLEAFYQEVGRAGRDGDAAVCAVIFSDEGEAASRRYLSAEVSSAEARRMYTNLPYGERDDAARQVYFIGNAFKGEEAEIANAARLLREYALPAWEARGLQPGDAAQLSIPYPHREGARADIERAIYRLLLLGILTDYTVDHSNHRFAATTRRIMPDDVRAHLDAYILRYRARAYLVGLDDHLRGVDIADPYERHIADLVWFVYDEIEKKRRTALRTVVEVMRAARDGEQIRSDLLAYLQATPFTERVAGIVRCVEPEMWWPILDAVITPLDARQLLGQCRRILEANPGDPGVLALQALALALHPDPDWPTVASDLRACAATLFRAYGWGAERVAPVRAAALATLAARRPDDVDRVVHELLRTDAAEAAEWRRAAYLHVRDPDLRRLCAVPYLETIRASLAQHYRTQLEAQP